MGQGYVGLTLACGAARAGYSVTGIDVDPERVDDLCRGILSVPGVDPEEFASAVATGRLTFTTETEALHDADIITICVPTPLRDQAPDLSHLERACKEVARHLQPGRLIVLESTSYPGTTDDVARALLEASGLSTARDFLLAYSPERIDPGNALFGLRNTPRIVGGLTPEATGVASLFYRQLVDDVVVVSSCRAAELAKLLENAFRHVNIALVNEMAMLCHDMGIDIWEVLRATESKPFGFMAFQPGPGVGGHCIPLDSRYLAWHIRRDAGRQFRMVEEAAEINVQMPAYVVSRIADALNENGRSLKGATILVLGVTYKPNVGDLRESPALEIMGLLRKRGATVGFHDPFVSQVPLGDGIRQRAELTQRTIAGADCVALISPHASYDLPWIADHAPLVFDARNAYGDTQRPNVVRL